MARRELTRSKALEYRRASKKRKGQILDGLCEVTGWSRDNARRQIKAALGADGRRKPRPGRRACKYGARAQTILVNAWSLSGTACGQYLRVQIQDGLLDRLVANGELRDGHRNKGRVVTADDTALDEVRLMSSATMDRYLKAARRKMEPLSRSTTKRSTYPLRNEIPFGKSYAVVDRPGYLSIDTVAHCGATLRGDHLWTLNATDVLMGWTETITVQNKAARWIREGHEEILPAFPFEVIAANYDGGSEFINREMIDFSSLMNYQMTRSRPYHSNDNAHVEQRNGDIVRRYAFRYRYEGKEALVVLNRLWYWVNLRKNYLVPTRKCIGHTKTRSGRTRGVYDNPQTPYQRAMASEHVSKTRKAALKRAFEGLNDAHVSRRINELQQQLLGLLTDKDMLEFVNESVAAIIAA